MPYYITDDEGNPITLDDESYIGAEMQTVVSADGVAIYPKRFVGAVHGISFYGGTMARKFTGKVNPIVIDGAI